MDNPTSPVTAIAPRTSSDAQVIRSPREYTERLKVWQSEHYHVLTPFANFSALPDHFGLVPTLVYINPDPAAGDVYEDKLFCKNGEVAIAKIGLSKIAMAAGMSITTVRTDDRRIQNLWEMRATSRFIGIDGTPQTLDGTEELDLRDGSDRAEKVMGQQKSQAALRAARAKGLRGCEARAINASIRQFGIKQKYTAKELEKPFVLVRVVYMPDMSDPATKQLVSERALGGSALLYGHASAARPGAEPELVSTIGLGSDVIDVKAEPERPATVRQPVGRLIEDVRFDMEAAVFEVRLDGGELLICRLQDVATTLAAAKKAQRRILATVDEQSGELTGVRVLDATPAPNAPAAPPTGSALPGGQTTVEKVEPRSGTNARGKWTLYRVTFGDGRVATTFSQTQQQLIDEAKALKCPVKVLTDESEGEYDDKITLFEIVDSRQGNLPVGEERKY